VSGEITGQRLGAFMEALGSAFNLATFDQMMAIHVDRPRTNYSADDAVPNVAFRVIDGANREGWSAELVAGALEANPKNPKLVKFAREYGLDPVPADQVAGLEKVVAERSHFADAELFLAEFAQRIAWTCRIVVPNGGGSGVLVGDDLVLTNHHVVPELVAGTMAADRVSCVFDHKMLRDGTTISPGRSVAVSAVVAARPHSPEDVKRNGAEPAADALDYALLRLAEKVGAQALGTKDVDNPLAAKRGHVTLVAAAPAVQKGDPLIVLQHPALAGRRTQKPVQLAHGVALASPWPKVRVRHNASTLGGSSGSPCFNADLAMVALHHSGDPVTGWERPEWNEAIPIGAIVADLAAQRVPKFWTD